MIKFRKQWILFICLIVLTAIFLVACNNSGGNTSDEIERYNVYYYIDGKFVDTKGFDKTQLQNALPYSPENIKEGHYLSSWYFDKELTKEASSIDSSMSKSSINVYARWIPKVYEVKFLVDGAVVRTINAEHGSKIEKPSEVVKEGYVLDKVLTVVGRKNWNFEEDTISADTDFETIWIKEKCLVSFDSNGGSSVASTIADNAVDGKVPEPEAPTKENYVFRGWYKESKAITKWKFDQDTPRDDITLYARWDVLYQKVGEDTFYFGYYPQTIKQDNVTIMGKFDQNASNKYYIGSDGERYLKLENIQTFEDGNITFPSGRTVPKRRIQYFKVEKIKWKVIKTEDGKSILLADNVLYQVPYGISGDKTYANASIRTWLNQDFYNTAFSTEHRKLIVSKMLDHSINRPGTEREPNPGSNTEDNVFLLNYNFLTDESNGYLLESQHDPKRKIKVSDYAYIKRVANGQVANNFSGYWWILAWHKENSSPTQYRVTEYGKIEKILTSTVNPEDSTGVVPAILFNGA